jgi:hypothetical protein
MCMTNSHGCPSPSVVGCLNSCYKRDESTPDYCGTCHSDYTKDKDGVCHLNSKDISCGNSKLDINL